MKIPKSFELGPFKIKTYYQPGLWDKEKKVGTADIGMQQIILQPVMPGCFNKKAVEQAFYHELFHMLLFYAGQRELYIDEVLVDNLANLMMQFLKTREGVCE